MSSPIAEGCYPVKPIWQIAVDKFYGQLDDGGIKKTPMNEHVLWKIKGPDVLIEETQKLMTQESHISEVWTTVLPKLKPVLSDLDDFVTVITRLAGMDGRVAAFLWGSMKLLFKFAHPAILNLVSLLEELRAVLLKARVSEKDFTFSESLESTLFDMYTEIILFYGYAIVFFRNNAIVTTDKNVWSILQSRFEDTITHLHLYSLKVNKIIDMTRLSRKTNGVDEVEDISSSPIQEIRKSRMQYHVIPYGLNLKFYRRSAEIEEVNNHLNPKIDTGSLKVISIYGLGGVGKTQLALQYANTSRDNFDAIAWIQVNTYTRFIQSLLAFALRLGLPIKESSNHDDYQLVQEVKYWLNESKKKFLLILDDVDDGRLLSQIWPASNRGSIIITSRSLSVAAERSKKVMQLQSFENDAAVNVLYELSGRQPDHHSDEQAAESLCRIIGGYPLAIAHMSLFIQRRGYSYEEFLAFYKKHYEKIFISHQSLVDYDHTLSTVWDSSLRLLSPNATNLLKLLSFFHFDSIPEKLFFESGVEIKGPRLSFLTDEFAFGDAVCELIAKTSFVNRLATTKSLRLHRLVKFATLTRMPEDERGFYLHNAIILLIETFKNAWDQQKITKSRPLGFWKPRSAAVPHLSSLMNLRRQYNLQIPEVEVFAEVLLSIGICLWKTEPQQQAQQEEQEELTTAKTFIDYGLSLETCEELSALCAEAYKVLDKINQGIAFDGSEPSEPSSPLSSSSPT